MPTVNIHAAKTHLSRLVEEAAAGEEIVITKAGRLVCCRSRPLSLRYVGILRGKDLPMLRATLGLGCIAAFLLASPTPRLRAAELPPRHVGHAHVRAPVHCGPCGCLVVTYVHHRAIGSTYGLGFDPRNYDQTEPHFYLTKVHAYPRYSVDGYPAPGAC